MSIEKLFDKVENKRTEKIAYVEIFCKGQQYKSEIRFYSLNDFAQSIIGTIEIVDKQGNKALDYCAWKILMKKVYNQHALNDDLVGTFLVLHNNSIINMQYYLNPTLSNYQDFFIDNLS